MYKWILVALSLATMFVLHGCTSDNARQEMLVGAWKFADGSLNGNAEFARTNYALYTLQISPDGTMQSQILDDLGYSGATKFELQGDKLVLEKNTFDITELTADKLAIAFKLDVDGSPYDVQMTFAKNK